MKPKLVVVGNGMAGIRTVEELLQIAPDRYDITVFGAEPHGNYNRVMLTPVLFGAKTVDDIMIHDFAWYRRHRITLHCGPDKAVVDVDRGRRLVVARDGTRVHYDKLLIATGSLPLLLDIPGRDVDGVMGFRDIADVETMIEKSASRRHALIVGGGLLGLEAANGLNQRGMRVTVINRAGHVLNKQLDRQAAGLLQRHMEAKGIAFRLDVTVAEIVGEHGHITQAILSDGETLPADMLVMATGIRPNIGLGQRMGLVCQRGIVVNDGLQTSDPAIYAVGECVQHRGEVFGLVVPVYQQARVCARRLAGEADVYRATLAATTLKVTGIELFSAGEIDAADAQQQVLVDHGLGIYRKIVIDNDVVIGMVMYGDTSDNAWYLNLINNRTNIAAIRDQLIFKPAVLAA